MAVWGKLTQSKTEHRNNNIGYGCEQWKAFWTWHWNSLFRNLYITWNIKIKPVALYSMQYLKKKHRRNMHAVLIVSIVWIFSGQCGHHRWSVWFECSSLGHTETAQCLISPVALSSFTLKIHVKFFLQLLQYHGLTASLWLIKWCPLYLVRRKQFSWHCQNF